MSDKSITPNDPANFTPERQPQISLRPFRFWCQKVLPLVYDDSLSYYELLCKVVDYLNKTMEDVSNMDTDITNLYNAYNKLQDYVNNYFSTLDVQEEINNKLDEMFNNGELAQLFKNYVYPCPEMYGAIGDGITDDTEAIQKAINENIGGTLCFKSKKYAISSELTVNVKGNTFSIILGNAEIIATNNIDNMLTIIGSDTTGLTDQSICKIFGGTLNGNDLAKCCLNDKGKLTVIDGISILNAKETGIIVGVYADDIASGAQKYSNINIGRTNKENYNTGCGINIGNPDGQYSNINIARYNIGVEINAGGCAFSNIHITAQFPSLQTIMPDCYGFYFNTPVIYRNNTSINNAYFDALKYCLYFNTNTGMVNITNSFYLLDGSLFSEDKIIAYMIGGTYAYVNVDNFNICGTTPKLNFRDRFCKDNSTYDLTYNKADYNRAYYQIPDLIDAGNLKGTAIIVSSSHPLTPNMYKRIGKLLTPIVTKDTNYFYPQLITLTLTNRDYGYTKCTIIFNTSNNEFKIIKREQFPESINDVRLFIQNGRNPIEIEGQWYDENDIYIYGEGLDGICTLKIETDNNYTRAYVRSIPDDNDVFNSVSNLTELTNHTD